MFNKPIFGDKTPRRPTDSIRDLVKGPSRDGAPMARDVETAFGVDSLLEKKPKARRKSD